MELSNPIIFPTGIIKKTTCSTQLRLSRNNNKNTTIFIKIGCLQMNPE